MSDQLTYWQWKAAYYKSFRHHQERLGQAFMIDYMRKMTWPELFYEENPFEAEEMILKFLDDNCYDSSGYLPQSYR